ncbi:OFA family MFS transporter [Vibrio sp. HN007]|uniref:L-lactate MFS transporter n=1 Tax=Vibrio iocasae TaxID=3098914 RepID=UPI0035D41B68
MQKKANLTLMAGCGINLCIGVLYTWSVFKNTLVNMGWSNTEASIPYTVTIVVLSVALLIAGRVQDKAGPRKVLMTGSVLAGSGMILSGFSLTPVNLTISFGVITGAGIGLIYACLNPTAMKWFHRSRKGFVNGLLATTFGLAAIYLAPLTGYLVENYGLSFAFNFLGYGLILIAFPLSCFIRNPPENYEPAARGNKADDDVSSLDVPNSTWREMLSSRPFVFLWLTYAFGASAGLMIIANITSIAATQGGITQGAYLIITLSLFNSGGRLMFGLLSDKIGSMRTLAIALLLQMGNMLLFCQFITPSTLLVGAAVAGLGYGALLAVFPSVTAELYGLKHYGVNYGVLYTAWGVGGFIGPVLAASSVDYTGSYLLAYLVSALLVGCATLFTFRVQAITTNTINWQPLSTSVES